MSCSSASSFEVEQNILVCCEVKYAAKEMVNSTEGARIPCLSWVDDLLPTYFTSSRPSACRLLPKTFAATIPMSDSVLRRKRDWVVGQTEKWERYSSQWLPTSPRIPAPPAQQGEEDAYKCGRVYTCQPNKTISGQRTTYPKLELEFILRTLWKRARLCCENKTA